MALRTRFERTTPQINLMGEIMSFVQRQYQGNFARAFDRYDRARDMDGRLNRDEFTIFLQDSVPGQWSVVRQIAETFMNRLGLTQDKTVGWPEFEAMIKGS